MPIEILMPALSPTMKEGNLAKWVKKEGDIIEAGEVIAEIETDKATMEVEAVDEGVLGKILISEGTENVAVNSAIALLLEESEDKSALDSYKATEPKKEASKAKEKVEETKPEPTQKAAPTSRRESSNRVKASPLAKRIAKDEGIIISQVSGTGPHGRIIRDDVLNFVESGGSRAGVIRRNPQEFHEVKNSNVRKVIASRLQESKQNVPHFYLSVDLNIDKLLELRVALNEAADVNEEGKPAYKISVNDLVIKASAMALAKVPEANSSWENDAIKIYNNVDISVAVAIDGGLITPIIKNADQKTIPAISKEMKELAFKAREGKLQPEEFQGGSFSISNLGMFGINNFQAIVNPPQSCILAIGGGIKKPVVNKDDKVEISTIMNVTLSSDHRSVDGAVGAQYLSALRKYIENPILMLI